MALNGRPTVAVAADHAGFRLKATVADHLRPAGAIVDVFLATGFDGGRHQRRLEEIARIEDEEAANP